MKIITYIPLFEKGTSLVKGYNRAHSGRKLQKLKDWQLESLKISFLSTTYSVVLILLKENEIRGLR